MNYKQYYVFRRKGKHFSSALRNENAPAICVESDKAHSNLHRKGHVCNKYIIFFTDEFVTNTYKHVILNETTVRDWNAAQAHGATLCGTKLQRALSTLVYLHNFASQMLCAMLRATSSGVYLMQFRDCLCGLVPALE